MTYRIEGNDPNRIHEYPTPAEVREMIHGAGADGFQAANRYATPGAPNDIEIVPDEEYTNVIHIERAIDDGTARERCATCGLIGRCWCQPGCEFCSYPQMQPEGGVLGCEPLER